LAGFEMLARWKSPTLGVVSPELFVPVAEEIGLIAQISEQLIRKALLDARNWDPRLTLSVNISPIQLRDAWFAQKLLKLLVEANFPPNRLEIEVTESCLHENIGLVRSMITSLQNQGVTVSLDDFGTGYSSLSQLRSLPFDRIKIDRSFVSTVLDSPESVTIIQSIISLGQGLGLPITAEGIESREVLAKMRELGKFQGQGYLYGYPEPAEETEVELAQLNLLLEPLAPARPAEAAPLARRA
jgi:EAL domain-containing protein (putative c-di-GMP-specific phosphodiesterase class I)